MLVTPSLSNGDITGRPCLPFSPRRRHLLTARPRLPLSRRRRQLLSQTATSPRLSPPSHQVTTFFFLSHVHTRILVVSTACPVDTRRHHRRFHRRLPPPRLEHRPLESPPVINPKTTTKTLPALQSPYQHAEYPLNGNLAATDGFRSSIPAKDSLIVSLYSLSF